MSAATFSFASTGAPRRTAAARSSFSPSICLADTCGLLDIPITRVENACATGNDAVRNAFYGVASGAFDVALVVGADKVRESSARGTFWEWAALTRDMAWDYPLGLVV